MRLIFGLFGCCLLVACAGSSRDDLILHSWKGVSSTTLIETWGSPTQQVALPEGGQRLTYQSALKSTKCP